MSASASVSAAEVPTATARPAYWWAGAALVCAVALLAFGAAAGIEVRPVLRLASLVVVCWAAAEDLRTRRLRNVLTAPALVLAIAGAPALPAALRGALVAPLPLLVIAIPRPEAMGMGDIKLAVVAGALAGFGGLPL